MKSQGKKVTSHAIRGKEHILWRRWRPQFNTPGHPEDRMANNSVSNIIVDIMQRTSVFPNDKDNKDIGDGGNFFRFSQKQVSNLVSCSFYKGRLSTVNRREAEINPVQRKPEQKRHSQEAKLENSISFYSSIYKLCPCYIKQLIYNDKCIIRKGKKNKRIKTLSWQPEFLNTYSKCTLHDRHPHWTKYAKR